MKTTRITCDHCEKDITYTENATGWRLAVINEPIPSRGEVVTSAMVYPLLERDMYFCSRQCLYVFLLRHLG